MSRFIPLSIPNFEGNERKYVDDAIDQGWVSTGGAYITKLEEQMAGFLHVEKVAACQSGTSADIDFYCSSESGTLSVCRACIYGL